MHALLEITKEVQMALTENKPVVALESTIISHGMPYPQNVEMATQVEDIIRQNGAVPATIAIMNGKIKIGLTSADLNALATAKDVTKVSRRDMAEVIAKQKIGATTVAATMICAALAGIKFFVTGGIGGVHRGYEETMDVSADLEELAMTSVTVICAGAKAILDLSRTMEYLETKGVPVIGYQTDNLPAFYTKDSAIKLRQRADSAEEIAKQVYYKELLGLKGGTLVVNPVPDEHSMAHEEIDGIIEGALRDAIKEGVEGKDATPYLLAKIVEKTQGKSLQTNIALVYNNAKVGAQIAKAFSKLDL
ncbi:MAG: pseudouridine-5-phosphate glycosidase [Clostridiales bacterium]|nr:MAG: pseudouridine-5-phosphate glycosidase [Clostridiales bacterium]